MPFQVHQKQAAILDSLFLDHLGLNADWLSLTYCATLGKLFYFTKTQPSHV